MPETDQLPEETQPTREQPGYYAAALDPQVAAMLQEYPFEGLDEEREVLRYFLRRVIELGAGTGNLDQAVDLLRLVAGASRTLTQLYLTDQYLGWVLPPYKNPRRK